MKNTRLLVGVAATAAVATALSACGSSGGKTTGPSTSGGSSATAGATSGTSTSGGGSSSTSTPSSNTSSIKGQNDALGKVFQASDTKGGTLRMANTGDWDSLDPADTYYAYSWNFIRNYGRSLTVFKSGPGTPVVVPDLATSLGKPSNGNKTWTYTLRKGVKYEDGTVVTSKDVKYAVERSLDKTTFPNGPTYFNDYLDLKGYTSPYKDKDPNKLGLKAIETPNDSTIIFHLKKAFAGFDYFAQLPSTIPVPQKKDTGSKYKQHVVSSGPYMFKSNTLGKGFTMVRNPNYDPATDPATGRKPLVDEIDVQTNVNADDIDNRLMSGDLDVDIAGTGVQSAAQAKIAGNPSLGANSDLAPSPRTWYAGINGDVAPLNNIDCRKAVIFAADKSALLRAYGGKTGGTLASSLLPPLIPGYAKNDLYNAESMPNGDVASAKAELTKCGKPSGFSTTMSYRSDRPKEKLVAEAMQAALDKVGIKLSLKGFPQGDYYKLYAGKPAYAKANGLGIMTSGWAADWPDGYGFLAQIVDSRVIRAAGGNTNLTVKDPAVDAMLDKAINTVDKPAREALWGQIDKAVMGTGYVLPYVWGSSFLYRPKNLTNLFVSNAFGMYDYAAIGTNRK